MSDQAAFFKFEDGWEPTGETGKDGMPVYRPVLYLRFKKSYYLDGRREATEDDIEEHPEPYKLYQKLKAGRDVDNIEGYPLAMWPAIDKAEFEQLVGHGIVSVEQLAKLASRTGKASVPEPIMQLAHRAKRMVDLQKSQGKFEQVIEGLRAERDALQEELREARVALSSANAVINTLQNRVAGIGTMLPERAA